MNVIVAAPVHAPVVAESEKPTFELPESEGLSVFVGVAATTTDVAADCAATGEPTPLFAVTRTRNVAPASAAAGVYVALVAPVTAEQFAPDASQRSHWYAYEIGVVPFHVPFWAVSAAPTAAELAPVTVGGTTFAGATACTTPVGFDAAEAVPAELVAVTRTTIVEPTSVDAIV